MPAINLSQPLLGAGAAAKNDWASASARTALDFTAKAEFKRGVNAVIGIEALASADAGLSQFIASTVRGNAFAEATAGVQVQFPLNLFDNFGVAVGAQATAQAAAGIEAGLGLAVRDFVELIEAHPDAIGIPLELIMLLLEEVDCGGKAEVHVAASAMAYASLQITGSVIDRPGRPAGFQYLVDAGVGLAAGMGFSGGLQLGFKDFRRFYGRAVDLCVDRTAAELKSLLRDGGPPAQALAGAFAPVAKVALRLAYELGDFIVKNNPANSSAATLTLTNHCVGIVLEESQRFLLERFVEAGLDAARRALQSGAGTLTAQAWDAILPQRRAVANRLRAMPVDPFQPDAANRDYWRSLQQDMLAFASGLPSAARATVSDGVATIGAAVELLIEMFRSRINAAQAYVVAVGIGQINSKPSFGGPLPSPPLQGVQALINTALGQATNAPLDFARLAEFLARGPALDGLRSTFPDVDQFARIFMGPVAAQVGQVLSTLLSNREAFLPDSGGNINPKHTLAVLLSALDGFITARLNAELKALVYEATPDELTRLYFDEVLLGAINFTKDVAFRTVLDWDKKPIDKDTFTEALASVMTMLLGRSLVIAGDIFFDVILNNMQTATAHAAARLTGPRDPFRAIGIPASPELRTLFADTLRIGGEVFGPLPPDVRARLRGILYEIMEPLPPGAPKAFVDELQDQFFIPNGEHVDELRDELLAISQQRFGQFVEKVLVDAGEVLTDAITEFMAEVAAVIEAWADDLADAIGRLGQEITALEQEIARLVGEMEVAFGAAADRLEAVLDLLASGSMRTQLKNQVVDEVYRRAKGVLTDNIIYQRLPRDIRKAARSLLKDSIRALVNTPLIDPVLDVIGEVAGALDEIVDDVRALDPHQPLAPQLLELMLSRIEDAVRDRFGSTRPHVSVGFTFSYEFFGRHTETFELGRIEIPFSTFFRLMRDAINALGALDGVVEQAAADLAAAFAKQFQIEGREGSKTGKTRERARLARIDAEHTAIPKQIGVLSPAPSSVHRGDVPVEIHLGGVPPSYLGLEADEQERVFIFVNDDFVPTKSLVVGRAAVQENPELTEQDFVLDRLQGFDADNRILHGPDATIRLGAAGTRSAGPTALARKGTLAVERRAGKAAGADGATRVSTRLANVRPGRMLTATQKRGLAAQLPAGTQISFSIPLGDLTEGTNTLSVVVVDRGGHRYEHIVSFAVTSPPRDQPGVPPSVRLPIRIGIAQGAGRTAPVKAAIGAGAARASKEKLAKASKRVMAQASRNLAKFRAGPR
jgi:hypothetical protein